MKAAPTTSCLWSARTQHPPRHIQRSHTACRKSLGHKLHSRASPFVGSPQPTQPCHQQGQRDQGGPRIPIPAPGLTCVNGTRVVVGVGTPLLAAAHGGSRLLAA